MYYTVEDWWRRTYVSVMEQRENTSKDEIKVEDVENNNGRLTTNQYS